jgi:hypothetical protein
VIFVPFFRELAIINQTGEPICRATLRGRFIR